MDWLVIPKQLHTEALAVEDGAIIVRASAAAPAARCPDRGGFARRLHSRYTRELGDLPWQGLPAAVRLSTRRWCCDAPGCARRIFTERFPGLVMPYGRRTARLDALLTALAFALGGRPGARLLACPGSRRH